jgi:hypothetical protein
LRYLNIHDRTYHDDSVDNFCGLESVTPTDTVSCSPYDWLKTVKFLPLIIFEVCLRLQCKLATQQIGDDTESGLKITTLH